MSKLYDFIVIGSGPAGVHAALALLEAGKEVLMLDGGITPKETPFIEEKETFQSIRRSRRDQHIVFGGTKGGGLIPVTKGSGQDNHMKKGRFEYMSAKTDEWQPTKELAFNATHTLAEGGLTEVWGGVVDVPESDKDLLPSYQEICNEIGVAGALPGLTTQEAPKLSRHAESLLKRNTALRPAALALLTEDRENRKATRYRDLDYWDKRDTSLYRARFTLEKLFSFPLFTYKRYAIVSYVEESEEQVKVRTKTKGTFQARCAILAAGAINSTRIMARSLKKYDIPLPLITKSHAITPCIDLRFIGKKDSEKKHSLCQLVLERAASYSQLYFYNSLLLFKLLDFSPLPAPQSLGLLALFAPSIVLVDTRFNSEADHEKTCIVRKNGTLEISYAVSEKERLSQKRELRRVRRELLRTGLLPLPSRFMTEGSTAHYAGNIQETRRIKIADSSSWGKLSAKPPTLTLMARARKRAQDLLTTFS